MWVQQTFAPQHRAPFIFLLQYCIEGTRQAWYESAWQRGLGGFGSNTQIAYKEGERSSFGEALELCRDLSDIAIRWSSRDYVSQISSGGPSDFQIRRSVQQPQPRLA